MPEEAAIEGDITKNVSGKAGMIGNIGEAPMGAIPQDLEHPLIWLFDTGLEQSRSLCRMQGLPAPAGFIWENFSRPLLNKALFHYMPENLTPQSPALCLSLGIGGLVAAHIPCYIGYQAKKAAEAKQNEKKIENKKSVKQNFNPEDKPQEPGASQEPAASSQEPEKTAEKRKPEEKAVKAEIKKISPEIMQKFGMNPGGIY